MTNTVPEMRSNKLVNMDIDQLRGWATFMDRAMIVSLIATIIAVAALGITTWLSFRYSGAVRAHEHASLERSKGTESQSVQLEQEVATTRERAAALEQEVSTSKGRAAALEQEVSKARERAMSLEREVVAARGRTVTLEQEVATTQERTATLEQEVSTARGRTLALEQEVSAARERASAFEQEASRARERAEAFEQAAREANERAARPASEGAAPSEKARSPQFDVAEIRQRLADLGKLVREANAREADPAQGSTAETPRPAQGEGASERAAASRDGQPSPIVASLRKYAGTNAAVFVLDPVADAPAAGSTISTWLSDAGWASQTWTWTGVAGIMGVVVLIKEGSDPATLEAASTLVEGLRSAGFNATKGDWPADWRRYRGALDGPRMPAPTDAPIRIVIGGKAR